MLFSCCVVHQKYMRVSSFVCALKRSLANMQQLLSEVKFLDDLSYFSIAGLFL